MADRRRAAVICCLIAASYMIQKKRKRKRYVLDKKRNSRNSVCSRDSYLLENPRETCPLVKRGSYISGGKKTEESAAVMGTGDPFVKTEPKIASDGASGTMVGGFPLEMLAVQVKEEPKDDMDHEIPGDDVVTPEFSNYIKQEPELILESESVDSAGTEASLDAYERLFNRDEDEAGKGERTQTLHEAEGTLDTVSQSPSLKRKKTSSETYRVVHAEETHHQSSIHKTLAAFSHGDDEYDALAKTYAAKLRRMPATQRDIAEKLISDVLFKGLQSNLTPFTCISDYGCTSGEL